MDIYEEQQKWFELLRQRTQEVKDIARKKGKLISDDKAKYIAKQGMPDFPGNKWDDR